MADYRVALIGTGVRRREDGSVGFGMNAQHAQGYLQLAEKCRMVACADIKLENAQTFADHFEIPTVYADYREMLRKETPDIVSISTWPHLHTEMTIGCAEAGVRAVHCEKPMAVTWGDCKRMARVCEEKGVQLTFNHQRRFGRPFREAKRLLESATIGRLLKLEFACANLYDWGTHCFDMCGYFTDQRAPEWALAQLDYSTERRVFGVHCDNAAVAIWRYRGGIHGQCATGYAAETVGAFMRLTGDEGLIEIQPSGQGLPVLRYRLEAGNWVGVDCEGERTSDQRYVPRAVADIVRALDEGTTSELSAANALQSTEIIFACLESVRRRGRVNLPIEIEDNPLVSMVEAGDLTPQPRE